MRDYGMLQTGLKMNNGPLASFANDFVLPPSGRLAMNTGGGDDAIRGMRPPGYRPNNFNANSAANVSQDTGFGHMTNIGSN